jgi:hypothetical protein
VLGKLCKSAEHRVIADTPTVNVGKQSIDGSRLLVYFMGSLIGLRWGIVNAVFTPRLDFKWISGHCISLDDTCLKHPCPKHRLSYEHPVGVFGKSIHEKV